MSCISIGLRVNPDKVTYAILQKKDNAIRLDEIIFPVALPFAEQLSFLRTTLGTILQTYKIDCAGIKVCEGNARTVKHTRLNIEGVAQECLASTFGDNYVCCTIPKLTAVLQYTNKKLIKLQLEGKEPNRTYPDWKQYSREQREALLVAKAALCK